MVELGIFDRGANTVTVNMARHSNPSDVASTVVHEATHQNRFFRTGNAGTQYEEFLSFRNESFFETGVRPSLTERQFNFIYDCFN